MPIFRFDKAFGIARSVKAFLNRDTRSAPPNAEQAEYRKKIKSQRQALRQRRQAIRQRRQAIRQKKQEIRQVIKDEKGRKRQQKIFQLKRELLRLEGKLGTVEERAEDAPDVRPHPWAAGESESPGAVPDFAVIGGAKCGTTFFYHLLIQHPHVEPAAMKEPHYFDRHFDYSTEWYRGCFPEPRWKDGQRTISGDGTPGYLFHPLAPERMAEVVPRARLIALLRNPVERSYSAYHHRVRNGSERRTFEEAVEEALKAKEARRPGVGCEAIERGDTVLDEDLTHGFLSRAIYVDHLLRWSEFFADEQMLVLKSEDFFEHPSETLKPVLGFLGLPDWEPPASVLGNKRNTGKYERGMDPATRRRLEDFFEPHNKRLYEHLGMDFGW